MRGRAVSQVQVYEALVRNANLQTREVIVQRDRGVYAFVDPLLKEYIKRFGVLSIETEDGKDAL